MTTDYVIRSTEDAGLLRTRFTVVDLEGHVVHVTIKDSALHDGHGDQIIRRAVARAQHRPKTIP